jgi:hypothetical protein
MSAEHIAFQLYELGYRVIDNLCVDNARVVVITGPQKRVCDVLIFDKYGNASLAFCKPSFFDNWTYMLRKANSGICAKTVHVEGIVFMVGKYFMERHGVDRLVADTPENRRKLLDTMDNVPKAVFKVLKDRPELEHDVLVQTCNSWPCDELDDSMDLATLKRHWYCRRDVVLDCYGADPRLCKALGRCFDKELMGDLFEDRDLDLIGNMVALTRASFLVSNPVAMSFCASVKSSQEVSDCDDFYALKVERLSKDMGVLDFFLPDMPHDRKVDFVQRVLREPAKRLGALNADAVRIAKEAMFGRAPAVTPGMVKLREIGFEEWFDDKVGKLETRDEALRRVRAELGMSDDEMGYYGYGARPVTIELFHPIPTFTDARDVEDVVAVVRGAITAGDIAEALMKLY